jgi:hypothetical protein
LSLLCVTFTFFRPQVARPGRDQELREMEERRRQEQEQEQEQDVVYEQEQEEDTEPGYGCMLPLEAGPCKALVVRES